MAGRTIRKEEKEEEKEECGGREKTRNSRVSDNEGEGELGQLRRARGGR